MIILKSLKTYKLMFDEAKLYERHTTYRFLEHLYLENDPHA